MHTLCVHQMKGLGCATAMSCPRCCPPPSAHHHSRLIVDPGVTSTWTQALEGLFWNIFKHAGSRPVICTCELSNSLPTPPVPSSAFSDNGWGFS